MSDHNDASTYTGPIKPPIYVKPECSSFACQFVPLYSYENKMYCEAHWYDELDYYSDENAWFRTKRMMPIDKSTLG